jgi:hypothetical protein
MKLNHVIPDAGNAVIIAKRMFKSSISFNMTGVGSPTAVSQTTCTGVWGFKFKISSTLHFQK